LKYLFGAVVWREKRTMIRAFLLAAAIGAAPFGVVAPARADDADFLEEMDRWGISSENGPDGLLEVGQWDLWRPVRREVRRSGRRHPAL
jgi:hypothetical protein